MIIIGCDYHPGVQQIHLSTATRVSSRKLDCSIASQRSSSIASLPCEECRYG